MLQVAPSEIAKSEVQKLVAASSIEILPKEADKIADGRVVLAPGTRVYIAYTSGSTAEIVRAAKIVTEANLIPVPHFPARRFYSRDELAEFIATLKREANASHALLVGGDIFNPMGPFSSTLEVLQTGLFEEHGFQHIALAGHPEGHPDVSEDVLREALIAKHRYVTAAGMKPYLATQFLFNTARLFEWQKEFVEKTIPGLPVDVGMPGFAKITTLMRFAKDCGVSTSFSMFTKHMGKALQLAASFSPEDILIDIAQRMAKAHGPTFRAVHLYPFGSFEKTAKWMGELKAQVASEKADAVTTGANG